MRLNQWSIPVLVAALLLTGAAAWRAGAQGGAAPTGRVATVNLTTLVDLLDERETREEELRTFIEQQNARIRDLGDQLELAQADLVAMAEGSTARRRKAEEVAELRIKLEVGGRFAEQLIDRRRAEVFAELFQKMQNGAAEVAKQQGFELVLNNDMGGEIPRDTEAQIRSVMAGRRVLFAADSIDITEAVARLLNNQWNAGRAANAGGGNR